MNEWCACGKIHQANEHAGKKSYRVGIKGIHIKEKSKLMA
jgi:hypothetical protein